MKKHIKSLQSLRLFAAMGVFLFHLYNNYLETPFIHPGTDFFMVTVGVVAVVSQTSHFSTKKWGGYMWSRYLRLYVTFIPVFVMYLLAGSNTLDLISNIKSFFFIPTGNGLPLVPQTWMISNFLVFYWLFGIAFVFRNEKILIPIFTLWVTGCVYITLTDFVPARYPEIYAVVFDVRNIEFLLGYTAGKVLYACRFTLKAAGVMLLAGILVIGISTLYYSVVVGQMIGAVRVFMYGIPTSLIIVGLAALEQRQSKNLLMRFMLHPWLVWMGCTSYILFLTHGIYLRVWNTILGPIVLAQVPILIAGVLITSALIYHFWEEPLLNYLREKSSKGKNRSGEITIFS